MQDQCFWKARINILLYSLTVTRHKTKGTVISKLVEFLCYGKSFNLHEIQL
jgi:hypothetical protein